MYLKSINFNHEEEQLNKAFLVKEDTYVRCRERIFFASILGYVMCQELYGSREEAPRELRTLTGDLQRTLNLITDPQEYDITLLNFMQYNRLAIGATAHYHEMQNNKDQDSDDNLKSQIASLVQKMIRKKLQNREENGIDANLDLEDMFNRIEKVKQSNSNFNKYMRLMGFAGYDHSEVDELLSRTLSNG